MFVLVSIRRTLRPVVFILLKINFEFGERLDIWLNDFRLCNNHLLRSGNMILVRWLVMISMLLGLSTLVICRYKVCNKLLN